jgi:asparagine synthase (glutamine-hydrolysing)
MCGIAGVFHHRSRAPVELDTLERMAHRLRHRGPDGFGFFRDGPVGFAHRRLAIIDLEGGVQPMKTPEEDLVIVYNGEVFNYVELFAELAALGHVPRTHSDTEAVLLAYRQWGLDFPKKLNGMFAIALWDARRRRLVLARDRMGVKPLYLAETDGGLAFASELKALRGLPGVDGSLDPTAIDEYMTIGYVVHPRTIAKGITKMEPGTIAVYEEGREPTRSTFWQLRFEPDHSKNERQWASEVRALFEDAVRLRLRADVPLGVLLSGGVDSTAISATVSSLVAGGHGVDSFCVGVDVPGAETEFKWARHVAERIHTRHHELYLSERQHGDVLVDAARLLDEPLAEPMVGQLLAVCRLAREHVTVVLSGEGSDEIFFGYSPYRVMYAIELAQRLVPSALLPLVGRAVEHATRRLPVSPRLAKYLRLATEPLERRYLGLNHFDPVVKNAVYSPEMRARVAHRDAREVLRRFYDDAGGPEPISRMAAVDCRAWLVDNTLLRSDFLSMGASVELRTPFMDYRLVELAARIPARFKVHPTSQKVILKRALPDRIPPEVASRAKVGFPTPLVELFRGAWGREAIDVVLHPCHGTEGLFDRAVLERVYRDHVSGARDGSLLLFQLLMLEHAARAGEEHERDRSTENVVVPRS